MRLILVRLLYDASGSCILPISGTLFWAFANDTLLRRRPVLYLDVGTVVPTRTGRFDIFVLLVSWHPRLPAHTGQYGVVVGGGRVHDAEFLGREHRGEDPPAEGDEGDDQDWKS